MLGSVTELCDVEIDHRGGEMGEADPAPARLVTPKGNADPILEPGEQVLDVVAPGIQLGIPFRRVDHASLGRGVDRAAIGGEGSAERGRDVASVERRIAGRDVWSCPG
jgi:hypothetical protein